MLEISETARSKTTRCEFNFECLADGKCQDCKIDGALGDRELFVVRTQYKDCFYCFPFGYAHICSCPARNEIYRKYNK
jgi:hypothetical protein